MALEPVPADIRHEGGLAMMADPKLIKEIMAAVTIPVFAKDRIGHFGEAQILQSLGVDMIYERYKISLSRSFEGDDVLIGKEWQEVLQCNI